MGGHLSKKKPTEASPSPAITLNATNNNNKKLQYKTELSSYEAACKKDKDLQSFDTTLRARTNHVISTLADGVEVGALSFDSLKEATGCLLEMNQEQVKVILQCKEDIWKNKELFDLVEEYLDNSLQTLDLCTALEKCLNSARNSQLLIRAALQQLEDEMEAGIGGKYVKTLEVLKKFKAAGNPFTEEFCQIFQSIYTHQGLMFEKLQLKMNKLGKKLKHVRAGRKVSSIIFAASFASVLILSVVAASMAAPPVAAVLAAAASLPLGSMGTWMDSLWKNYENALKGQKELVSSMHGVTFVAVKEWDNIRVLIDMLQTEIEGMLQSAEVAVNFGAVKIASEEIKKKLGVFMKNVEDLGVQDVACSREIMRARTEVLQKINKNPNKN